VIASETSISASCDGNERGEHAAERAEAGHQFSRIVEQCCGDPRPRRFGPQLGHEATSNVEVMPLIRNRHLIEERPLPRQQRHLDEGPVCLSERTRRDGPEEASDEMGDRHDRRARGWLCRYTSSRRSCETFVYTWVVEIEAWPSISCTIRKSAP